MAINTLKMVLGYRGNRQDSLVEKGMPWKNFQTFLDQMGLTLGEASTMLRIPVRTLNRRKNDGCLNPAESDQVYRAARVFSELVDHKDGNMPSAARWIRQSNPGLSGRIPFLQLGTDIGSRQVSDLIGRLEHFGGL